MRDIAIRVHDQAHQHTRVGRFSGAVRKSPTDSRLCLTEMPPSLRNHKRRLLGGDSAAATYSRCWLWPLACAAALMPAQKSGPERAGTLPCGPTVGPKGTSALHSRWRHVAFQMAPRCIPDGATLHPRRCHVGKVLIKVDKPFRSEYLEVQGCKVARLPVGPN
jgi:hypothetical protein